MEATAPASGPHKTVLLQQQKLLGSGSGLTQLDKHDARGAGPGGDVGVDREGREVAEGRARPGG